MPSSLTVNPGLVALIPFYLLSHKAHIMCSIIVESIRL